MRSVGRDRFHALVEVAGARSGDRRLPRRPSGRVDRLRHAAQPLPRGSAGKPIRASSRATDLTRDKTKAVWIAAVSVLTARPLSGARDREGDKGDECSGTASRHHRSLWPRACLSGCCSLQRLGIYPVADLDPIVNCGTCGVPKPHAAAPGPVRQRKQRPFDRSIVGGECRSNPIAEPTLDDRGTDDVWPRGGIAQCEARRCEAGRARFPGRRRSCRVVVRESRSLVRAASSWASRRYRAARGLQPLM